MTKITLPADCGDAPKQLLLRDLNIAFARAEVDEILALLCEDITWHIVGEAVLKGKAAVRQALVAMQEIATRELIIHSIITQGREGAVNGVITTDEGQSIAFCDVCQFSAATGGQIQTMTSYTIEINEGT